MVRKRGGGSEIFNHTLVKVVILEEGEDFTEIREVSVNYSRIVSS